MGTTNCLSYKGYFGSINVSIDDNVIHGKIECINDLVTYEAETVAELKTAFEEAVDDYIETCREVGKSPDKTMSGTFNVRIGTELHKKVHIKSVSDNTSINEVIKTAVERYLDADKEVHMHVHIESKPIQKIAAYQYKVEPEFVSPPALTSTRILNFAAEAQAIRMFEVTH